MVRFMLKRKHHDQYAGALPDTFYTIDAECPDLEAALDRGGRDQFAMDLTELIGVEILPKPEAPR